MRKPEPLTCRECKVEIPYWECANLHVSDTPWGSTVATRRVFCDDCAMSSRWTWEWRKRGGERRLPGEWKKCPVCGRRVRFLDFRWRRRHYLCSTECGKGFDPRPRKNPTRSELECDGCGQTFSAIRSDARYCSSACRQRAYRQRRAGR